MSTTKKNAPAATTLHAGATKYRIGTREVLQNAGWVFTQRFTGVDEYTKDGVVAQFFHGPKNTMVRAEISDGKGPVEVIGDGQLKLERAIAALLGTDVRPWYMTDAELKALPPLGEGSALIKVIEEPAKEDVPSSAVSPEAKPVPKPAPRSKASAAKAG